MRERISTELKDAMKARDKRRISTLRLIATAIKDRDIAARSNGNDKVSDAEILDILAQMVRQRRESIKAYEEGGRLELAEQEAREIEIIQAFMPRQLSPDETAKAVADVIAELSSESLKDMGRTMAELKKRYAGRMDFAKASALVKQHLASDRC